MSFDPISAIVDAVGKVIDKVFPDKTEAEKIKVRVLELKQSGGLDELKTILAPFLAEAQSADKFTSRARPSFFYVMYILILYTIPYSVIYALAPAFAQQMAEGMTFYLKLIPSELWGVFGAGFSVYTIARSYWDKRSKEA